MEFREALAEALARHDMTQADLARAAGLDTSLVSLYMSGKRTPTASKAIQMANALGETLDELCGLVPVTDKDEKRLVDVFRGLNEEGRAYLMQQAEIAASMARWKKERVTASKRTYQTGRFTCVYAVSAPRPVKNLSKKYLDLF